MSKSVRYFFEYYLVHALMFVFANLPVDMASNIGGFLGRHIIARVMNHRKAHRNLLIAFPNLDTASRQKIIYNMWCNLGRVFAEYPHLEQIGRERVELIGGEYLADLAQNPRAAIFFSAHLANWEVSGATAHAHGVNLNLVYRAANNTRVDEILRFYRSLKGKLETSPKSSRGMRQIVDTLKTAQPLGILIDQKYNQGIEASFFGKPAMTSPAFIQLAQKFSCPLYPTRVERLKGARFRITIHAPLDTSQNLEAVITEAHHLLEDWITAQPAQWLWLHRRWK
jgi:Kdo2-lipid IVA lauroyltransferase/acyltransferase